MREKNIGINVLLNVFRKSITFIFPIITIPYAIKVLGVENIGKVNYGHSIITYFNLIAMLGISQYAIREGAKRKNNKIEFTRFVREVFTINIYSSIVAYILLATCILFVPQFRNYIYLLMLQSMSIVFTTVGVDWINNVYEDFFVITIRSILAYLAMFVFLFVFVRKSEDYYRYALLPVLSDAIVCITNLFYCRKYVSIKLTIHPNLKKHFRPIIIFFANAVATSIYVSIDTTMLGWIKGDYDVGLYSLAVKIYLAAKSLMIAMYNVSIPRLAYLWGNRRTEDFKNLVTNLFGYITVLLIPLTTGLFVISKEVLILIGGNEYLKSVSTLQILSIALLFAILGGLVCDCLNVAIGREKDNMLATIMAAGINFLLNLFLIPYYSYIGAAITTLIAEAFVTLFCFIRLKNKKNYLEISTVVKSIIHSSFGSLLIIGVYFFTRIFNFPMVVQLIVIICLSGSIYLSFMLVVKDYYAIRLGSRLVNFFVGRK